MNNFIIATFAFFLQLAVFPAEANYCPDFDGCQQVNGLYCCGSQMDLDGQTCSCDGNPCGFCSSSQNFKLAAGDSCTIMVPSENATIWTRWSETDLIPKLNVYLSYGPNSEEQSSSSASGLLSAEGSLGTYAHVDVYCANSFSHCDFSYLTLEGSTYSTQTRASNNCGGNGVPRKKLNV